MLTYLKQFRCGRQPGGRDSCGHIKQRRPLSISRARTVRPTLERLEDRRVPSTLLQLFNVSSIQSFARVGFRENEVATLSASVNGAPDPNVHDFNIQIKWGDGQTSAGNLVYVGNSGSNADFLVKGSHVYKQ